MFDEALHILLVEDNPGDAELTTEHILQGAPPGSMVVGATTLREALSLMEAGPFDLVVTDLGLPDSHGEDTLGALRSVCRPGSILVVTGMDDEETGMRALRDGAADYLLKSELNGSMLRRSLRHALERLRRHRLEDELHRADKLKAVSRLTSGIAHHFNNLLTIIMGNACLIQGALEPGSETERQIKEVLDASDRAALLTRHLLQFCASGDVKFEPVDVNQVLLDIEPTLRDVLGERVELVLGLSEGIPDVAADRISLEQALLILALNGRDAMRAGGRLTVTTRPSGRTDGIPENGNSLAHHGYVVVTVADEGDGVSQEDCESMFEPFFTTKDIGRGNGLGLAAVHGVVKQAGGHVDVVSRPGAGTSLSICLPALRAA